MEMGTRYIYARGSADGICATALYLRGIRKLAQAPTSFVVTFCESFELKELLNKTSLDNAANILVFIDLDINSIILRLNKFSSRIAIYTDKAVDELRLAEEIKLVQNTNVSTARIIYNTLFGRRVMKPEEISFETYLALIGDLADRILNFRGYPAYSEEVKDLNSSLTLRPYDNEFRKVVLNHLVKGQKIQEIEAIRQRAIKVEYLTKKILDLAPTHKIWGEGMFVLYEYQEDDVVSLYSYEEVYKMRGRFSYLTQRLAIINRAICLVLVHSTKKSYIVLRKHRRIRKNLLQFAEELTTQLQGTYGGHPGAVSINFPTIMKPEKLIRVLQSL